MARLTVDFGIDLGTTNSVIGVLRDTDVEIIKNNEDFEYTPSAVHIDKSGNLIVGRAAKQKFDVDHENTSAEFKLQMGTDAAHHFSRSGRRMRPEELSAEVLKSLKYDVNKNLKEDLQSAVITVPAAFELPQCEATKKAAQLSGISFSPLLQEPVAAALAYGFQSDSDKVFWLVYDFGGGTFDAAVMQVRDGVIQVVNHGGDNHLGGKLIDWAIVEDLLIPALLREYPLRDFRRGNPKWNKAIAKLKLAAEEAKILLSRMDSTSVSVEFIDDEGEPVEFDYNLRRSELERLTQPFIHRSLNICRKVLSEKRLGTGSVEKILLVGGPTRMPFMRECLTDPLDGLGIPLEFTLDPMTVVARGAAIFAGTQRMEGTTFMPVTTGQYAVELDYKPVGSDPEPLVGGQIMSHNGEDLSGFTIEFVNADARPQWRSGKVSVEQKGFFNTTLWAEKGRKNTFTIELFDKTGHKFETVPDSFPYTIGVTITDPPLIHSVGVALANNEVKWYFEKGAALPVKKRVIHKTVKVVSRGQPDDAVKIPVVEGDQKKADRNRLIGYLEISSQQIKRDIPVGSDIEITIEIDQSRLVKTEAYISILDQEFEKVLEMEKKAPDPNELEKHIATEKERLEKIKSKVTSTADEKAAKVLEKIENERMVEEVESSLDAARVDRDAADKCQNGLLNLKATVDELEEAMEIPALISEGYQIIEWTREIVGHYGKAPEIRRFEILERELTALLESRSPNVAALNRKIDEMDSLRMKLLAAQPDWWVGFMTQLEEARHDMTNQVLAEQLFAQGLRSIQQNDLEGLKAACLQLLKLLPVKQQQQLGMLGSTVQAN